MSDRAAVVRRGFLAWARRRRFAYNLCGTITTTTTTTVTDATAGRDRLHVLRPEVKQRHRTASRFIGRRKRDEGTEGRRRHGRRALFASDRRNLWSGDNVFSIVNRYYVSGVPYAQASKEGRSVIFLLFWCSDKTGASIFGRPTWLRWLGSCLSFPPTGSSARNRALDAVGGGDGMLHRTRVD